MPTKGYLHKYVSLPFLRSKQPLQPLSLVHLAPIPKIPVKMPSHPNLTEVEHLIDLVDCILEEDCKQSTR